MNKFFIFVFILSSFYINAQFNLLNASSPEEVGVKTVKQEELDFIRQMYGIAAQAQAAGV